MHGAQLPLPWELFVINLATLRFYATPPHQCSYIADEQATILFVGPRSAITSDTYSHLSTLGFRRSGEHIYRPHCDQCNACIAVRIPVHAFTPNRKQRRIWKRNDDLQVQVAPPRLTAENYALYARYITWRHGDGDMFPPSRDQFREFLMCKWNPCRFINFRLGKKLVAVAVTDQVSDGLSSIYTFYDPDLAERSLGHYAILQQIRQALESGKPFVYLGYWIEQGAKMHYKQEFRPLELYLQNRWSRLIPHA